MRLLPCTCLAAVLATATLGGCVVAPLGAEPAYGNSYVTPPGVM